MTELAENLSMAATLEEIAGVLDLIGRRALARLARKSRDQFVAGNSARAEFLMTIMANEIDGMPEVLERLRQHLESKGVDCGG